MLAELEAADSSAAPSAPQEEQPQQVHFLLCKA